MYAIRGATTIEQNSKQCIESASRELIEAILTVNGISPAQLVDIFISTTSDITKSYPASAIRGYDFMGGFKNVPLFSSLEPSIEGSLPLCIRLLVHVHGKNEAVQHVYLNNAALLRPDLAGK